MAVLPILLYPDPRLQQPCAAVTGFDSDLVRLATDMFDTMYDAGGRGLAAPQVGVMLRLFVMDIGWKEGAPDPRLFVNPAIAWTDSALAERVEGCLSLPDCPLPVRRPEKLRLNWRDHAERGCAAEFAGIEATCIQHECDHLDGVLILDRVGPAELAEIAEPLAALRAAG